MAKWNRHFRWFAAAVATLGILKIAYLGGKHSPPDPSVLRYLPYSIGAGVFFLIMRGLTDNYYLFDRQRREVLYHFECAVIRWVSTYLPFDQIKAIGVHGSIHASKHSRWYEYQVQLVDQQGQFHPMSDSKHLSELPALNQRAENLARLVGCPCLPGKSEHQLVVSPGNHRGEPSVALQHVPLSHRGITTEALEISFSNILIGVVVALGAIIVLIGLLTLFTH